MRWGRQILSSASQCLCEEGTTPSKKRGTVNLFALYHSRDTKWQGGINEGLNNEVINIKVIIPWGTVDPWEMGTLRPTAACISGLACWDFQPQEVNPQGIGRIPRGSTESRPVPRK